MIYICVQAPSDLDSLTSSQPLTPPTPDKISLSHAQQSVGLWAKSAIAYAVSALNKPRWQDGDIGGKKIVSVFEEMLEARKYVEIVAASNAGEATDAEGLIRALKEASK